MRAAPSWPPDVNSAAPSAAPLALLHRKEETELFARIRARTHEADAILDALAREHESGQGAIRELEQALLRVEERGCERVRGV